MRDSLRIEPRIGRFFASSPRAVYIAILASFIYFFSTENYYMRIYTEFLHHSSITEIIVFSRYSYK
jgi:hypothetical protein